MEDFYYLIFFIVLAYGLYKLKNWNTIIRREKKLEEVTTKGHIINNYMQFAKNENGKH